MNPRLFISSIAKKVIMAVTGAGFILFLLFHGVMNLVSVFSHEYYDWICEFLGAHWYAVLASLALAGLAGLHVLFALILTLENYIARGGERYKVTARADGVRWASKNMLVLGVVILLGLGLHLYNFWYKMQCAELLGLNPENGNDLIINTFSNSIYSIVYLLWLLALWFHISHGFSSMLQTVGCNGKVWKRRWQVISDVVATIVVSLFVVVVLYYWLIFPNQQ